MSHRKERSEKTCLNCNTQTVGRFCHICGQENVEPKETFGHLLRHFIEDLTHFDGKFFKTISLLFTKPGFLPAEYIKGRRASYLNPIRFYIFVSALFFLLLMSVFIHLRRSSPEKKENATFGNAMIDFGNELKKSDSIQARKVDCKTVAEYDSLQLTLPESEREGTVGRYFMRKMISANQYQSTHNKESNKKLQEKFFHSLPYALFLSLPIVGLALLLLYWRRKEQYYVSHIIFLVYMYCFVFLLQLLIMTVMQGGTIGYVIGNILRFSIFIYLFMAMRRFYGQSFSKTLLKFILFSFSAMAIIVVFSLIVAVNALFNLAA